MSRAGARSPEARPDQTALRSLDYAVVDVETTGGSSLRGHRVTEIAAYRVDFEGRPLDEMRTLINPQRPVPRTITRLTNITQSMVDEAPLFEAVVPELQRVLAGAVFVAHNAQFDLRFVRAELQRTSYAPPRGRVLCTARLARKVVPEQRYRSLDALSWFFGFENEARHRAWGDAAVTVRILARLLDRAEDRGIETWGELETLLRRRATRKKRTALPHSMEWVEWA